MHTHAHRLCDNTPMRAAHIYTHTYTHSNTHKHIHTLTSHIHAVRTLTLTLTITYFLQQRCTDVQGHACDDENWNGTQEHQGECEVGSPQVR